jgi:hypothetical protein
LLRLTGRDMPPAHLARQVWTHDAEARLGTEVDVTRRAADWPIPDFGPHKILREAEPVIDAAGKWPGIMIIMTALLLRFAICIVSILALSKGAWHFLG